MWPNYQVKQVEHFGHNLFRDEKPEYVYYEDSLEYFVHRSLFSIYLKQFDKVSLTDNTLPGFGTR